MSYELFQQGPAVYIPLILISLVVTVFAYGAIPYIVARTRNKPITKKKYNFMCYGWNFIVMILFIAINGEASGGPYLLWTWIFARRGLNTLASRGVLEGAGSDYLEDDPNRIVECKSCGYRNKEYFEACPQCGKHAKQYVYLNQEKKEPEKPRFCRKCGEKLIDGSKFCRKCGTEVVEVLQ